MDDTDFPYSPEFIRDILAVYHLIEALKEKGSYILDPIIVATGNTSDKREWEKERSVRSWSRPTRKSNSVYRVDDIGCVVCDIDRALDKAISPKQKERLMRHYLYGYEYAEIAKMEGDSNETSVKVACWRAINKMSEFLEAPAVANSDAFVVPPRDDSYHRKYESIPRYA